MPFQVPLKFKGARLFVHLPFWVCKDNPIRLVLFISPIDLQTSPKCYLVRGFFQDTSLYFTENWDIGILCKALPFVAYQPVTTLK